MYSWLWEPRATPSRCWSSDSFSLTESLQVVCYCCPVLSVLTPDVSKSWKDCFMLHLVLQRPERRDYQHGIHTGYYPESCFNCSFLITRETSLPSGICFYWLITSINLKLISLETPLGDFLIMAIVRELTWYWRDNASIIMNIVILWNWSYWCLKQRR